MLIAYCSEKPVCWCAFFFQTKDFCILFDCLFDAKLCSWPESNQWPVSVRSSSLSGGVTLYQLSYRNTRKNPLRSQFIHQTVFCLLCMPTLLWLWNHERKQCYNVTNIGQRESILVSDRALVLRSRSYKQSYSSLTLSYSIIQYPCFFFLFTDIVKAFAALLES